jgi:hypothetical protein
MSAMVMDMGGLAPLADLQDTVLPSVDTVTVPSCFLNWAAALDMLVEERWCHSSQSREPQMCIINTSPLANHPDGFPRSAPRDFAALSHASGSLTSTHKYSITLEHSPDALFTPAALLQPRRPMQL